MMYDILKNLKRTIIINIYFIFLTGHIAFFKQESMEIWYLNLTVRSVAIILLLFLNNCSDYKEFLKNSEIFCSV